MAESYEALRKKRLEENMRRMKDLGLKDLSKDLAVEGKPQVQKIKKIRSEKEAQFVEPRRSSRVAGAPKPDYRDDVAALNFRTLRRGHSSNSTVPRKYCNDNTRIAAAEAAEKIQENLTSGCPSFVKLMLHSHTASGFWLGLPRGFCQKNFPKVDTRFILEDEKGLEWESLYLAQKNGLSGGWRGFSMDHGLEDGDAVVFEVIKSARLKVHIVRASDYEAENKTTEGSTGKPMKQQAKKGKSSTKKTKMQAQNKRKRSQTEEKQEDEGSSSSEMTQEEDDSGSEVQPSVEVITTRFGRTVQVPRTFNPLPPLLKA